MKAERPNVIRGAWGLYVAKSATQVDAMAPNSVYIYCFKKAMQNSVNDWLQWIETLCNIYQLESLL